MCHLQFIEYFASAMLCKKDCQFMNKLRQHTNQWMLGQKWTFSSRDEKD